MPINEQGDNFQSLAEGSGSGTQGGTTGAVTNALVKAASANTLADTGFFETTTGILQVGGKTNAFPAITRNSTNLKIVLADGTDGGSLETSGSGDILSNHDVRATRYIYLFKSGHYVLIDNPAEGVLNTYAGDGITPGWVMNLAGDVLQTGDVTKNNNVTVADLTGLSVNLTTGRKYSVEGTLFVDSSATGAGLAGIKITFAGTATASAVLLSVEFEGVAVGTNVTVATISGTASSSAITLTDAVNVVKVSGTIICDGTGTFKLQGAQASAVAADTIFKTNSKMMVTDVA